MWITASDATDWNIAQHGLQVRYGPFYQVSLFLYHRNVQLRKFGQLSTKIGAVLKLKYRTAVEETIHVKHFYFSLFL